MGCCVLWSGPNVTMRLSWRCVHFRYGGWIELFAWRCWIRPRCCLRPGDAWPRITRSSRTGFVGRQSWLDYDNYTCHEVEFSAVCAGCCFQIRLDWEKTIEAWAWFSIVVVTGRIIGYDSCSRSLVNQWLWSLAKFTMVQYFDEKRFALLLWKGAPEGIISRWSGLVICSDRVFGRFEKRTTDRFCYGHVGGWRKRISEWSVARGSPEYSIVDLLSSSGKRLLLLTATQENGGGSHFARLRFNLNAQSVC